MRVLSVVGKAYYGSRVVEPMYLYFTVPLQTLGHTVESFDHYATNRAVGKEQCTARLVQKIREGAYDLVLYQTSGNEPVATSALADLAKKTCIVAWNSDDDWQWNVTSRLASDFTFMITTYPSIYEQYRTQYPNLLLSQWGCLEHFGNRTDKKDLDFSFAGALYGPRNTACRFLKRAVGLVCFGRGSRLVALGLPYFRGAFKIPWLSGGAMDFQEINSVWDRTRISYTPMEGGPKGEVLSIKSRTFDMGLSGTLMLCNHSPDLEQYYQPGIECVTFDSLSDCAEKAQWYLSHEAERRRVAENYRNRTLKEHLWTHRFANLFSQIGLGCHSATA
jgi:Glycosyl transferases group 1